MLRTESFVTDVVVVGSGIAGMMAAIEARKGGAQVALVSKSALGKESSTSYARTFRASKEDPATVKDIPGYDSKPGKHLEDWPLVRAIYEESTKQMQNVISLGVPMVLIPADGPYDTVPSWRPRGSEHTHGGAIALDILSPVARKMGIRAVESCSIISLLREDDRVAGVSGLLHDGSWLTVHAKAVVMATGGAAGINRVTSTSKEIAGNGFAMALKAGLRLKSMEFNSFYAVGLPTPTGRYVHCAPMTLMMKNALLRNDKGEDIVKRHLKISLQEAVPPISVRFDWLPRAVAAALEEGKVWLDLTRVPASEWDRLPERNWKQIRQAQVDMKQTPLPILPLSQSFRGGLAVDTGMRTSLKGLYAVGEAAAGWLAELGISALPSCLTMGAIAGRAAAADLQGVKPPSEKVPDEGLRQALAMLGRSGKARPEEVGEEIRELMHRHASPIKNETSLAEGLRTMERLDRESADMNCQSAQELRDGLEAKAMFLTGKAMLRSALLRTESRGGFYRSDFPNRDDEHWLRPVLAWYEPNTGEVRVERGERMVQEGA